MTSLRETIDNKSALAKTKRLDLSFNELLDMYASGELEISPEFQRIFVWDEVKQSQFIESLLLELPVPPIYVVEHEEGKYVLVDGLQRLSTYLHFRGELVNKHKGIKKGDNFALEGCDIVKELNTLEWKYLETAMQIRLKRAFVSVQVIRKESDQLLKFHMFKRLNDGGTPVSAQQVRNCVLRMLPDGNKFLSWVVSLANEEAYKTCCTETLGEDQINDQFDQELILRFFTLKNNRDTFKHLIGPFIDEYVESICSTKDSNLFNYTKEEALFKKTFTVLLNSTGESSFTFANKRSNELTKGFSAYHFEAVTLGIQCVLDKLDPDNSSQMELLKAELKKVRLSTEFREVVAGGGRNSPGPFKTRIALVEEALKQSFP